MEVFASEEPEAIKYADVGLRAVTGDSAARCDTDEQGMWHVY